MRFVLVFVFLCTTAACAQQTPCGLSSMSETSAPAYPPIARAAHVEGDVIMLATFSLTGEVEGLQILYGPPMLRAVATKYVMSWHANQSSGPRTCPIVVRYRLSSPGAPHQDGVTREDLQHVTYTDEAPVLDTTLSIGVHRAAT